MAMPNYLGTAYGLATNPWGTLGAVANDILNPNTDFIPGVSSPVHYPSGNSGSTNQNTPKPGGGGNTGAGDGAYSGAYTLGATAAAPAYDPADLAYLDDQEARLNRQLASSNTSLANGLTQLEDSFNSQLNDTNTKESRALQDFGIKREDTTRSKDAALTRTDANARTLANSLRQRIGLASGSGSSAYQITAPGAVARDATKNRTGVLENFGQNFRNLDLGEKRVKEDFEEARQDLGAQRRSRESDFRSGILDRQNQIGGSLAEIARQRALLKGGGYDAVRSAMAPQVAAIDARQAEIDSLFSKYRTPYSVRAVDTSTPELRNYTVDRAAFNANNTAGATDPTAPYGQFLRQDGDEEEQRLF